MNRATTPLPSGAEITALHDRLLAAPDWPRAEPAAPAGDLWLWLQTNHRFNSLLWAEEDLARRTAVADASHGRAYFKVYRQFKMYNDPRMNPVLVQEQRAPR